jgi:hypothetical protein
MIKQGTLCHSCGQTVRAQQIGHVLMKTWKLSRFVNLSIVVTIDA